MSDPDLTHTILVKLQSDMAAMRGDMAAMRGDMNTRFDAVDRRFDSLEDRVEQVEHHTAVTNSKLDAIYARQESLEVVRHETWAQIAATAMFTNRFEHRQASEIAELRARIDKLEHPPK
jgi:chromosome segregation ATPase